jgi:hypothetical protein
VKTGETIVWYAGWGSSTRSTQRLGICVWVKNGREENPDPSEIQKRKHWAAAARASPSNKRCLSSVSGCFDGMHMFPIVASARPATLLQLVPTATRFLRPDQVYNCTDQVVG